MDLAGYIEGWKARAVAQARACEERTFALKVEARVAAKVLASLGAQKVILFGSVAEGRARADSDIDLAVEGIPPERIFEAFDSVEAALDRRVSVDIVRIESGMGAIRQVILEGEVLFES